MINKNERSEREVRVRFWLLRGLIVVAVVVLLAQLWQLQIVQGQRYQKQAEGNRLRLRFVPASRGIIYDRNGGLLTRNHPSFTVSVVPADLPDEGEDELILQLANWLQMAPSDIGERIQEGWLRAPYQPTIIKSNVPRDTAFIIQERQHQWPGVWVEIEPIREYPDGAHTAHQVGYVGRVPSERADEYTALGYDLNDLVGLTGIELTYEQALRGIKGSKIVEVNSMEREIRTVPDTEVQPRPGQNVYLTLDTELQRQIEQVLAQGIEDSGARSGVAVVMNVQTGEILASVSLPNYDNNLFSGGITVEDYQRLQENQERPLVNHAISGQYPPGSTIKIVFGPAALQEGVVRSNTHIFCAGTMSVPDKYTPGKFWTFYCWNPLGHHEVNFLTAISLSCDVYFYTVGGGAEGFPNPLGLAGLERYAGLFGLGDRTGISLPGESVGLVPNEAWKLAQPWNEQGEPWVTGDTYNMAIGQGFVLVTPLQLLNAAVAVANGGTLYKPQIVHHITDADGNISQPFRREIIRQIPIDEGNLALVRQGMREGVIWGTAHRVGLPQIEVAAKTGTAEYGIPDEKGTKPTHAWMVAFAPYEKPEIAAVVFLESGGGGSQNAGPVMRNVIATYYGYLGHLPSVPAPAATPLPEE
ncbi:MAG: penicillin-binding protein 2 [Chloroflexi bacterium]|nr:penicillin-binding protein 2 [Chloroflexota bacterium]MBU1747893.1 penicillin-binding protein 2 [Chloroflexota bacterium]MBU1879852.1 penicillin-binding protein 2 [Chloroflexota bacterium]